MRQIATLCVSPFSTTGTPGDLYQGLCKKHDKKRKGDLEGYDALLYDAETTTIPDALFHSFANLKRIEKISVRNTFRNSLPLLRYLSKTDLAVYLPDLLSDPDA